MTWRGVKAGLARAGLAPVTLELGGKSPVLVGRTADIGDVARRVMKAKTFNAGQICHAPDYVLLPKGTEDAFVAFATKAVHDMYGALKENGDYTSIINERHFNRLRSWTEDAKHKGARVIELNPAGEDFANSDLHRLPPSLILDVNEEMTVMQDEIFGPLLPIKTYDNIEEAITYVRNLWPSTTSAMTSPKNALFSTERHPVVSPSMTAFLILPSKAFHLAELVLPVWALTTVRLAFLRFLTLAPSTGAYGRAYTQQYPYGGRTSAWGYNPTTDTSWTTQQGHGYYAQWGTSTVTRGDQTIQAGHVVTNYGSTGVVKGQDNLYAGHDGNVYKRDDNGDWSKWDNGQWNPVNPPSNNKGANQSGQNNLSSQNQQTNRQNRNANGASTPGQPTNRRDASGASSPGQPTNRRDASGASSPGRPTNRRDASGTSSPGSAQNKPSPGNARGQAEKTGNADKTKQSSDDLTDSLNREASGRQRGSKNASAQQRYQQRRTTGSISSGERSVRGGNGRTRRGE